MLCFNPYSLKITFVNDDILHSFQALIGKIGTKMPLNFGELGVLTNERDRLLQLSKINQIESATAFNYWFLAELLSLAVLPEDQIGWKFAPVYSERDGAMTIDLWSNGQPPRIQAEDLLIIFLKMSETYNEDLINRLQRQIDEYPDDEKRVDRYQARIEEIREKTEKIRSTIKDAIDAILLAPEATVIEPSFTSSEEKKTAATRARAKKNGF